MATDNTAMFKLSYGLFILTAREGEKDNGCVINTLTQISDSPKRVGIAVNKNNYTHDMIIRTSLFNASVLTEDTAFETFKHFGFQSGKNVDKLTGLAFERAENGAAYIPWTANAVISGKVVQAVDCSSHTLFIADVTEAIKLSDAPSATYDYYFKHIKPAPAPKKKGWICKICGYVYEGDELPEDFVCPVCKHGAQDFERIV